MLLLVATSARTVLAQESVISSASVVNEETYASQFVVAANVQTLQQTSRAVTQRTEQRILGSQEFDAGSCVSYAKYKRPDLADESWGYPNKISSESLRQIPFVGAIVFTTEGRYGHVGFAEGITGKMMYISECNYVAGRCGTRWIALDNPIIRGFK